MMTRDEIMTFLTEQGCKVIGTTEEFSGSKGGVWLSGEENDGLFEYYAEGSEYELGVLTTLSDKTNGNGWYFEWNDPGTMMCWPI
jgi:hypothetical protein